MKPIGPELAKIRKMKKITVQALSKKLNISVKEVERIEFDKKPSKEIINKVCKALGISKELVAFKVITKNDVATNKKEAFRILQPAIDKLINSVLKDENKPIKNKTMATTKKKAAKKAPVKKAAPKKAAKKATKKVSKKS